MTRAEVVLEDETGNRLRSLGGMDGRMGQLIEVVGAGTLAQVWKMGPRFGGMTPLAYARTNYREE